MADQFDYRRVKGWFNGVFDSRRHVKYLNRDNLKQLEFEDAMNEDTHETLSQSATSMASSTVPRSIISQMSEYIEHRKERPFHQFRSIILIVSLATMTMAMANPLVLNFTIICMVKENDLNYTESDNETEADSLPRNPIDIPQTEYRGIFQWSGARQSTALSSFSWGAILAILPISYFSTRYGVRKVFASAVMISSLATISIPPASLLSFKLFIFLRMIQGIGYGAAMPLLGSVAARWAPIPEIGRFTGFGAMCFQLSPVVSMPLGGAACTSAYGWPLAYYVVGSITATLTILWFVLYRETPAVHPWVSPQELELIYKNKGSSGKGANGKKPAMPFRGIITSLAVWAIIVATIGNMFSMYVVIYFIPTYLRNMMKLDLQTIGIVSAIPTFCQAIVKLISGVLSDKLPLPGKLKGNETFKVKLFNTIAFCGAALFYLINTAVNSHTQSAFAITMFSIGVGILGCSVGAFFKSATLVGRRFSPLVMGLVQMTTCITILILPYIVKPMIKHETFAEWTNVLIMAALVLVATNVFFCIFASGQGAPWTYPGYIDVWPSWCHRKPIEDSVKPNGIIKPKSVWNSNTQIDQLTVASLQEMSTSPNLHRLNGHIPASGHKSPNGYIPVNGYIPPNGHIPTNGNGHINSQYVPEHKSSIPSFGSEKESDV